MKTFIKTLTIAGYR